MPSPSLPDFPLWGQIAAVFAFFAGGLGLIRQAWKSDPKPATEGSLVAGVMGSPEDSRLLREQISRIEAHLEIGNGIAEQGVQSAQALERALRDFASSSGTNFDRLERALDRHR